jgi:hypothetical protein
VQITGTASAPRVRLFSEPEMPEAEKLAWVMQHKNVRRGRIKEYVEKFPGARGLNDSLFRQPNVNPAGEEVLLIPDRVSVTKQNQRVSHVH